MADLFRFEAFEPIGPFDGSYDGGLRPALGVLWRSQRPGRHEARMKYSSARRARSVYTNLYRASARGIQGSQVWRSEKHRFVTTDAPSDTEWYDRFATGFRSRVGERRKQDAAISIEIMLEIQRLFENEWQAACDDSPSARRSIAEPAVFFIVGFCGSMRGFELPKTVLTDLRNQIHLDPDPDQPDLIPHLGWPLRGRFKARSRAVQQLLIFIAAVTASGLEPGTWAQRLVDTLAELGIERGWLFQDGDGNQKHMLDFADEFYNKLLEVEGLKPNLFPKGIDIIEDYGLARSLRRGATTRATNAGLDKDDIDWMNRWNTGGEEVVSGPMRVVYAERRQLLTTYLRFSKAL